MLTDEQILELAQKNAGSFEIPANEFVFSLDDLIEFARAVEATCKQSLQVEREKAYDALSPDGGVSFVDRQIKIGNEVKNLPLLVDAEQKSIPSCPFTTGSGYVEWHNGKARSMASFEGGMPFLLKDAVEAYAKREQSSNPLQQPHDQFAAAGNMIEPTRQENEQSNNILQLGQDVK